MQALVARHYDRVAAALAARKGGTVPVFRADVGGAFTAAAGRGEAVLAGDGHHASPAGAALAAEVLWSTLAAALGEAVDAAAVSPAD